PPPRARRQQGAVSAVSPARRGRGASNRSLIPPFSFRPPARPRHLGSLSRPGTTAAPFITTAAEPVRLHRCKEALRPGTSAAARLLLGDTHTPRARFFAPTPFGNTCTLLGAWAYTVGILTFPPENVRLVQLPLDGYGRLRVPVATMATHSEEHQHHRCRESESSHG